ncbi:hypothetical protein ACJRO7_013771 [Eucalyptus globulus]|uniref:Uncharacterized protein n=1 Tax=Eucalyptus globulus TaxID=34317 RepID=A0ABD3KYX1_EUCGL
MNNDCISTGSTFSTNNHLQQQKSLNVRHKHHDSGNDEEHSNNNNDNTANDNDSVNNNNKNQQEEVLLSPQLYKGNVSPPLFFLFFSVASFGERLRLALEITQAMQYLLGQKPRGIHREMKPSNVFLDDVIRELFMYMASEVIWCKPYNEKCDVYSFEFRPTLPKVENGQLEELVQLICLSRDQAPSI